MSDHRPIDTYSPTGAPSSAPEQATVKIAGCAGCGGAHAGIMQRILCLETSVRTLRAQRTAAADALRDAMAESKRAHARIDVLEHALYVAKR